MNDRLRLAFAAAHLGFSSDRVIADPALNEQFVRECRNRELTDTPGVLNRRLMNLRERGELKGIKTTCRTSFSNDDEYRFASEMAVRFLERRDHVTLDDIVCDPDRAAEFDNLAERIAPGYSPLEYRWAALGLRKSQNLPPEQFARLLPSEKVQIVDIDEIDMDAIPRQASLYLFFTTDQALYAGETENLHRRLRKHLDHSDNKGLARWMWEHGSDGIWLEIHLLAGNPDTRVRRALEAELIRSRRPVFNTLGR